MLLIIVVGFSMKSYIVITNYIAISHNYKKWYYFCKDQASGLEGFTNDFGDMLNPDFPPTVERDEITGVAKLPQIDEGIISRRKSKIMLHYYEMMSRKFLTASNIPGSM